MTQDRDLEQMLDQWFTEGPNEVADRVLREAFDQIALTPRRRAERATRRITTMSNPVKWMAAAIFVGLIGYVALGGPLRSDVSSNGVLSPSPSPSPSPSVSPSVLATVPAELRYPWLGSPQAAPAMSSITGTALAVLDATSFVFSNNRGRFFKSSVASSTPGQITLTSTDATGDCTVGDQGVYDYTLSPGGTKMEVTPVSDACAARSAVFTGEWLRAGCKTEFNNACLGPLEAGTYKSFWMLPIRSCASCWNAMLGGLTYTVPEGWTNPSDYPASYTLKPQAGYDQHGKDWSDEIDVFAVPQAGNLDNTCSVVPDYSVGNTLDKLLAWVTSRPGLTATAPQPITIGGLSGRWVDLELAPAYTTSCGSDPTPQMGLYSVDPNGAGYQWSILNDRERHIFLDLGGGQMAIIVLSTLQKADFDAFVAQAMPIVESFQFAGPDTLIPSPATQPSVPASPAG